MDDGIVSVPTEYSGLSTSALSPCVVSTYSILSVVSLVTVWTMYIKNFQLPRLLKQLELLDQVCTYIEEDPISSTLLFPALLRVQMKYP